MISPPVVLGEEGCLRAARVGETEARPSDSRTHELKTWPEYFNAVADGSKPFEVRKNDRDFYVGDRLWLREYCPARMLYTGNSVTRTITYLLIGGDFGIEEGHCVLGLSREAEGLNAGPPRPKAEHHIPSPSPLPISRGGK